ncbi:PLDc N-terminal domain-containing protein [Ferruginibacter sp. SUN106]|uniref:PLDc N-terminal domain-containing protein n=1 Tax=Ferruginibacter sp. SUN106 TaxID=2978348 RepID=UPI003D35E17D
MFYLSPYFYYITVGLQVICAIHCIRKDNQAKWLWLIIFLPVVGSLIYIFTEMFSGNDVQKVQSGVGAVFNPSGKIKKLEDNLRFADTFANKVALADAYLEAKQTQRAITLYESCLSGNFTTHEYVNIQLINAYADLKQYDNIIPLAKQIYTLPQFARSRAHMLYAIALSHTGNADEAEKEFKLLKGRFSNYESRYWYGSFLLRMNRNEDAKKIYEEMLGELAHLDGKEKRNNRIWFNYAREDLKKINNAA